MKERKEEMCKNYYKGESGETKFSVVILVLILVSIFQYQGRIPGEGRTRRASPLKLEKNIIFWRKIVIFLHEITQKCSRLPRLGAIFLSAPPLNLESWIRPWKWYDRLSDSCFIQM